MGITNDSYQFTKNVPVFGYNDHAHRIIELCRELGYRYYMYGGMAMQIEPDHFIKGGARFFISFTELNNARQIFHEASGGGYVINVKDDPDAFEHFIAVMRENVDKGKEAL